MQGITAAERKGPYSFLAEILKVMESGHKKVFGWKCQRIGINGYKKLLALFSQTCSRVQGKKFCKDTVD